MGEYKYYDMDQVIAAALERCEDELGIERTMEMLMVEIMTAGIV